MDVVTIKRTYTAGQAATAAGVAYHHVYHWDKTGLLKPSVQQADGYEALRLYSFGDIVALKVVSELRQAGFSCEALGKIVGFLQARKYSKPQTDVLVGTSDGTVKEVAANQLAAKLNDREVGFAWILDLGRVIDRVAKDAAGIKRAKRGRASQVA
jgi:DNA-binding transcriptional MerR regulator